MLLFIILEAETFQDTTLVSIHHMLLFILAKPKQYAAWRSFNTSHVTLYQSYKDLEERGLLGFNTSHVTLYQRRDTTEQLESAFQYITCYSLSSMRCGRSSVSVVSIHHMLLFILTRKYINRLNAVYIHHMLLFIDQGY